MMLAPLLVVATALSSEPAWYHPDDVAVASEVFARSASETAARFDAIQRRLEDAGNVLTRLDVNVSICGTRATPEFRDWAIQLRKQVTGQYLRLQAYVDVLTADYESTFEAALERATAALSSTYNLKVCKAPRIMGPPGTGSCQGKSLNAELGARLDRDAVLQKEVQEILSIPWPELTLEARPQAVLPVTGTARYIDMDALVGTFLGTEVDGARDALQRDLEPLEADMKESDDPAVRARTTEQARALRDQYEKRLAQVGDRLFTALEPALVRAAKKGAPDQVGVCANPKRAGACQGEDVTATLLPLLEQDKKLARALD